MPDIDDLRVSVTADTSGLLDGLELANARVLSIGEALADFYDLMQVSAAVAKIIKGAAQATPISVEEFEAAEGDDA